MIVLPPAPKGSAIAARAASTRRAWVLAIAAALTTGTIATVATTCGRDAEKPEVSTRAPSAPAPAPEPPVPAPDSEPPVPASTPPVTPPAPPPPVTPPAPPPPADAAIEIALASTPSGAAIEIDGSPRGVTPARLSVGLRTKIIVRRSGYRTQTVVAERAGPLMVRLQRRSTPRRSGETLD